jgi:hypothetical protein
VALGGGGNIVPVLFAKVSKHSSMPWRARDDGRQIDNTRKEYFRNTVAVVIGLTVVWALNIAWCFFILHVVPQYPPTRTRGARVWLFVNSVP